MSTKHTPGPWIVGDDLSGLYIETDSNTIGWVCDVDQIGPEEFEQGATTRANARLIAAGPDMLAALRVARDCILLDRTALSDTHMNPVTNTVDDEDGIEGLAQYDAALSVIDAAIAKATGEQA